MKKLIFCILFLSTNICLGQTTEQKLSLIKIFNTKRISVTKKFPKDTILVNPVYWQLLATYDGKKLVPQSELANRVYKFTSDGKCRIADNLMRSRYEVVHGTWNYNMKDNLLTLHLQNQDKVYKVIIFNQVEMLLEDNGYARFYLTAKPKYEEISGEMKRRLMLEF